MSARGLSAHPFAVTFTASSAGNRRARCPLSPLMFLAAIIPLTALNTLPPEPPPFFGRAGHALFLNLVADADPALADARHEPRGDKPFTVSNPTRELLRETRRAQMFSKSGQPIRAGEQFAWRVTTFDARLSQTVLEKVLPQLPREVRLGAARFEVGASITARAQHRWAGISDAHSLWQKWFHETRQVDKQLALEFASPTAYRHIHRNMLLPLPEGIFTGYLAAWNAHGAPTLEQDLIAHLAQAVSIRHYQLTTTDVNFGAFREAGWLGVCRYTIHSEELALRRVLHLLADFAFYCGTGYKTTQGMGQTRKVSEEV